jgi:hypothetical protein
MCWCAVDLLALPLDLAEFLVNHPRPVLESVLTYRMMLVEHEVVSP